MSKEVQEAIKEANYIRTKSKEYDLTIKIILDELDRLNKENKNLKQTIEKYHTGELIPFNFAKQLEQKDKIIDLMAKKILSKFDYDNPNTTKEEIIQYFENKVKEDKQDGFYKYITR